MSSLKYLFILIFLFAFWSVSFSQTDSLNNEYRIRVHRHFSNLNYVSVRIGTGVQRSFYSELGISLQNRRFGCTGFFSRSKYVALEFIPNLSTNENQFRNVYALKTGIELNAMAIAVGAEAKYQTDFSRNAFVVTPKVGLGIFGDVLLFYGYNFSTRKDRTRVFPFVSNHQFSLILNLHNDFLHIR